nr:hypothetical protein [Legionella jordanis]
MSIQELLKQLQALIEHQDWGKEVNFNGLRAFSRSLVFFHNPSYALEYSQLSEEESLSPKGITAINRLLKSNAAPELKVAQIKKKLMELGYDGQQGNKGWIRTEKTHQAYCSMAKAIMDFEKNKLVVKDNLTHAYL